MLISLAISVLWLAIGILVICLCVYLLLRVIKLFTEVPDRIEQGIWLIVVILCLIGGLTLLAGGSAMHAPFRFG